jgi:Ni,Fe-hydrogenase III large subunit
VETLSRVVEQSLARPGCRFGHATARRESDGQLSLQVLLLNTARGGGEVITAPLPPGATEFPSLTPRLPAAHWAERAIGDMFGLVAHGHPRWKSLLLHEAWPEGYAPLRDHDQPVPPDAPARTYAFLKAEGDEVHEIPVGPIHAGIIEPGHFRFSCLGEVIANLEIRLGYQHRGVERRLTEVPWPQTRFVAEAASSDTAAGNGLANAVALEEICEIAAPLRAQGLRTMALEVERLANHLGDMGGLSADIGFSAGAALFARLRGQALGLGERLTGTRLQRAYVLTGGVARDMGSEGQRRFGEELRELRKLTRRWLPLLMENSAALDRMEGTGRVSPGLAREFGLVGPAGRASGSDYDARRHFTHGLYPDAAPPPAQETTGDVLARARVRATEIESSLDLLERLVTELPTGEVRVAAPETLPGGRVGIGVVEAWRGELIHWVTTDSQGRISRYAIKDPSFNNWTGLAIAVRSNLVADFPLCNKSFNLSYSGNDL